LTSKALMGEPKAWVRGTLCLLPDVNMTAARINGLVVSSYGTGCKEKSNTALKSSPSVLNRPLFAVYLFSTVPTWRALGPKKPPD